MIQIKILSTLYTPQDLEKAAAFGAEGFGHVTELDSGFQYIAFSKVQLPEEVAEFLIQEIEDVGYINTQTFEINSVSYELI